MKQDRSQDAALVFRSDVDALTMALFDAPRQAGLEHGEFTDRQAWKLHDVLQCTVCNDKLHYILQPDRQ